MQRARDLEVVGEWLYDRDLTGEAWRHAAAHEHGRTDQEARRDGLGELELGEPADLPGEVDQALRDRAVAARLGEDDLGLDRCRWVVETQRHEALPGGRLELAKRAAVAGVVAGHEHELRGRDEALAEPVDVELAAVIGQRVEHDDHVLARLGDLVEVEDRPLPNRARHRTVLPCRVAALHEPAPEEIGGAGLLVAGDRDQRPLQLARHRLDVARLAATGWPLHEERQPVLPRASKHLFLRADGAVVRCHSAVLPTRLASSPGTLSMVPTGIP